MLLLAVAVAHMTRMSSKQLSDTDYMSAQEQRLPERQMNNSAARYSDARNQQEHLSSTAQPT